MDGITYGYAKVLTTSLLVVSTDMDWTTTLQRPALLLIHRRKYPAGHPLRRGRGAPERQPDSGGRQLTPAPCRERRRGPAVAPPAAQVVGSRL